MTDVSAPARVPFGYKIVNGRAVVDEEAAGQLIAFFDAYLSGLSMAEAARRAKLTCPASTYHRLFTRREYSGTEYYPAIVDPDYQARLIAAWEGHRDEKAQKLRPRPRKGVPIYTEFCLVRAETEAAPSVESTYQKIQPIE